jgi:Tfp pilus assembly protein PilF
VLIERGRMNDHAQVLELYRILERRLTNLPLTDGAFTAVTTAAERTNDQTTFLTAAGQMIAQHPGSSQTAQVMWRLAEVQDAMGDHDLAQSTLRQLAERFPRNPLGQQAARRL